jgi:hypothetical protein
VDLWLAGYCGGAVGFVVGFIASRLRVNRRNDTDIMRSRNWRELVERYGTQG